MRNAGRMEKLKNLCSYPTKAPLCRFICINLKTQNAALANVCARLKVSAFQSRTAHSLTVVINFKK
tara:strand:+ start:562 stop:759 length:198 start_codon:yes stop_codon:yes gene_type:complete